MYEKGYQTVDTAISSVFTKMKGVSYTNISGKERIWDVADYVFPEQVGCVIEFWPQNFMFEKYIFFSIRAFECRYKLLTG